MSLIRLARKTRTVVAAGLTALASTTFQGGCSVNELNSLLDTVSSDFEYIDSYDSWEYGYDDYYYEDSYDDGSSGWSILDVKSG